QPFFLTVPRVVRPNNLNFSRCGLSCLLTGVNACSAWAWVKFPTPAQSAPRCCAADPPRCRQCCGLSRTRVSPLLELRRSTVLDAPRELSCLVAVGKLRAEGGEFGFEGGDALGVARVSAAGFAPRSIPMTPVLSYVLQPRRRHVAAETEKETDHPATFPYVTNAPSGARPVTDT